MPIDGALDAGYNGGKRRRSYGKTGRTGPEALWTRAQRAADGVVPAGKNCVPPLHREYLHGYGVGRRHRISRCVRSQGTGLPAVGESPERGGRKGPERQHFKLVLAQIHHRHLE